MGRQQGLLITDAARPLAAIPRDLFRRKGFDGPWPVVVGICNAVQHKVPARYRRELEAATQAGGLTDEERSALIVANVMLELQPFGGCSSLLVDPSRSSTRQMVFGRNLDFLPLGGIDRLGLVTIYRPNDKHAFVSVGFPGFGGVFSGMNDAGLSLATHTVGRSRENEPLFNPLGELRYWTFREILEECSTVDEAEELLRKKTGYIKSILLVACDTQRAAVFEITTRKVVVRGPEENLLICTNDYRTPQLCRSEECSRYDELAKFRQRKAPVGHLDVIQALRTVGRDRTLQSMVFEPESLRLRVALGTVPVWDHPFVTLDLATLFRRKVTKESQ
jgi:hypothetical protein